MPRKHINLDDLKNKRIPKDYGLPKLKSGKNLKNRRKYRRWYISIIDKFVHNPVDKNKDVAELCTTYCQNAWVVKITRKILSIYL